MLDILPASSMRADPHGARGAPSALPVGERARGYLAFMLAGQALVDRSTGSLRGELG